MRFPNRAVTVLYTRSIALKFQNKAITGGSTGSSLNDISVSFQRPKIHQFKRSPRYRFVLKSQRDTPRM